MTERKIKYYMPCTGSNDNIQSKPEHDQLKVENEILREGLKKIYDIVNNSDVQYAVDLVITMQDIAQQTLNEVAE